MPDPVIKTIFAANGQEAEKVMANLERKFQNLEQQQKRLAETGKRTFAEGKQSADGMGMALESVATKAMSIAAPAALIGTVFRGATGEIEKFGAKLDEVWGKQREMMSKWQAQEGLTPQQVAAQMPAVKLAATKTPVQNLAGAMDAQRQLASVGIDDRDVKSGAALSSLLKLRALSQAYGDQVESPEATATGVNQFLRATGGGNRAADLERVGSKVAALSADSALNVSDLKQLSQNSAVLTQYGMGENEQLVAYESQGGAVAGTGLRNVVSRLGTAGADKNQTAALGKLGLKPEDVAIAAGGVTFEGAMTKLRGATAGMDETQKNVALSSLFGQEAMSTAGLLLSDTGWQRYQEGMKRANNAGPEGEKRVAMFESSREAILRRTDIIKEGKEFDSAKNGATWDEYRTLENSRKAGAMADQKTAGGRVFQGCMNWTETKSDAIHEFFGATPEGMHGQAGNTMLQQVLARQNAEIEKQSKLLEQIANEAKKENRPINRNAQVEAAQ